MQGHGVLKPQNTSQKTPRKSSQRPPAQVQQLEREEQPPIDPNLFSMYPDGNSYSDGNYPYPSNEQSYGMPSLEQIANEVLVDMNGNEYHDPNGVAQQASHDSTSLPNGVNGPEKSVDSAISIPSTEALDHGKTETTHRMATEDMKTEADIETRLVNAMASHNQPAVHPSIETNGVQPSHVPTSPNRPKSGASNLPLYQPPAPLSQSPDNLRRPAVLPNGISQGESSLTTKEATPSKRKRDSNSATPGTTKSTKKFKVDGAEGPNSREPSVQQTAEEKQSMELARALQQEDLGLRRRSR